MFDKETDDFLHKVESELIGVRTFFEATANDMTTMQVKVITSRNQSREIQLLAIRQIIDRIDEARKTIEEQFHEY